MGEPIVLANPCLSCLKVTLIRKADFESHFQLLKYWHFGIVGRVDQHPYPQHQNSTVLSNRTFKGWWRKQEHWPSFSQSSIWSISICGLEDITHFATPDHTLWTAVHWSQLNPTMTNSTAPNYPLRVSWFSVLNEVASAVTGPQPCWLLQMDDSLTKTWRAKLLFLVKKICFFLPLSLSKFLFILQLIWWIQTGINCLIFWVTTIFWPSVYFRVVKVTPAEDVISK